MKNCMRQRRRFVSTRAKSIAMWITNSTARYFANYEPSDNPRAYMGDDGWLRYY